MQHIRGQAPAIDLLQRQLASARLHHAYIFHGPSGVGKFTTALALAQALLCHEPQGEPPSEPCGHCESCNAFATTAGDAQALSTAHPDLHVVSKELARYHEKSAIRDRKLTQIPVEVLREHVLEPVAHAARLGHGRVFLIDEAELLNDTGQNLLLKTLEEPPGRTTLILITASEDRLLPTIRSRCQRVGFRALSDEQIEAWVADQPAANQLTPQQRQWLILFAAGSIGRAALAMDYSLVQWAEQVLPALDGLARGRTDGELGANIASLLEDFAKRWVDAHANASKEAANRHAADLMGSLIATHARRQVVAMAGQCDPGDPETGDAMLEPWLNVIDAVHKMQRMLRSNVNLSLSCDHLVSLITRELVGSAVSRTG